MIFPHINARIETIKRHAARRRARIARQAEIAMMDRRMVDRKPGIAAERADPAGKRDVEGRVPSGAGSSCAATRPSAQLKPCTRMASARSIPVVACRAASRSIPSGFSAAARPSGIARREQIGVERRVHGRATARSASASRSAAPSRDAESFGHIDAAPFVGEPAPAAGRRHKAPRSSRLPFISPRAERDEQARSGP